MDNKNKLKIESCHGDDGFTLIELMVSMGIFIVFLGVVSTSYISVVRSQRQANDTRGIISEARDFMQTLTDDFRTGTVDYDCYDERGRDLCPIATERFYQNRTFFNGQTAYLALADKDRRRKTVYWFDSEKHTLKLRKFDRVGQNNIFKPGPGFDDIENNNDVENGWRVLFSDKLRVVDAAFEIYPVINPYLQDNYALNQYQFQPSASLLLTFDAVKQNSIFHHFTMQTSFSSRTYGSHYSSNS